MYARTHTHQRTCMDNRLCVARARITMKAEREKNHRQNCLRQTFVAMLNNWLGNCVKSAFQLDNPTAMKVTDFDFVSIQFEQNTSNKTLNFLIFI